MTDHERIGKVETVVVNFRHLTGVVFHVRENGWACVETRNKYVASGPAPNARQS